MNLDITNIINDVKDVADQVTDTAAQLVEAPSMLELLLGGKIMDLLPYLSTQYPWLVYVIGGLSLAIAAYGGYVKLTPSKKDDERWAKIKNSKVLGTLIRLITRAKKESSEEQKK